MISLILTIIMAAQASVVPFEPVIDTKTKVVWVGKLPSQYSFERAPVACDVMMGARLPTKTEMESLIRKFDHNETPKGPVLTEEGRAQLQKKFNAKPSIYWTSTTIANNRAYVLYSIPPMEKGPQNGDIGTALRTSQLSALCVRPI